MVAVSDVRNDYFAIRAIVEQPPNGAARQKVAFDRIVDLLPMSGAPKGIHPFDQDEFHL